MCCSGELQRAGASPGDLLQREPQRLGVGELAVEQLQRGPQRRQLAIGELDRRQVEVLRRQRVVLLLDQAVDRLLDRQHNPERLELGAVGVEAARERVLVHRAVALDVAPDLRSGHGTPLSHQVGDQRELTDQLFCVLGHRSKFSWAVLRRSYGRVDGTLFAQFWSQSVRRRDTHAVFSLPAAPPARAPQRGVRRVPRRASRHDASRRDGASPRA